MRIDLRCHAGTYVRSLARDLGDRLGCGGYLAALRRTEAAGLHAADAVTPERLEALAGEGRLGDAILPVGTLLPMARVSLDPEAALPSRTGPRRSSAARWHRRAARGVRGRRAPRHRLAAGRCPSAGEGPAVRGGPVTAIGMDELPAIGPAVITLGAFDGLHLGHRHLAAATAAAARDRDAASVALVFGPHPDEVVRPGTVVERLLPPEVTLGRLSEAGIDHAIEIRFDEATRSLEPEAFLAALAPALEVRAITMTPDSAFGRNAPARSSGSPRSARSRASMPSPSSRCSWTARRSRRRESASSCAQGSRRGRLIARIRPDAARDRRARRPARPRARLPDGEPGVRLSARAPGARHLPRPGRASPSAGSGRITRPWSASGCGRRSTTTVA